MKKKYVRPESRLFVINFTESIASSSSISTSVLNGNAIIKFTHSGLGDCRKYYTGDMTAIVYASGNNFMDYYNELDAYGPYVYHACFRMQ